MLRWDLFYDVSASIGQNNMEAFIHNWHSSDRFSGTVRARESAQTAPGSGVRCR